MNSLTRRQWLGASAAAGSLSLLSPPSQIAAAPTAAPPRIRYCLNTSTIRGQKLSIEQEVDLAGAAGYDGIEPWIRELETYRDSGKPLADLAKRIADAGLRVESAIGFAPWIVDDDAKRQAGLEQLKRDMDLVRQIGGARIAAPPIGQQQADAAKVDLLVAAERYHAALEVGRQQGVVPQVEVWGHSKNLSRLGESAFVAIESGHPDACILPDVYHLYKGGSPFGGLGMLSGTAIHCFHFNDYPAQPPRTEINDSYRVYPGDGVAPWPTIIGLLQRIGFAGAVSLELFNKDYWSQDPQVVVETGLKKMKAVCSSAV
jgi:2-keto-myo-inositol isomerase